MATKAEQFRSLVERSGPKRASTIARVRTDAAGGGRHPSERAGKKATYALEDSAGKPSRKSSRKSAHRQKTDGQFRMKRRTSEATPREPAPSR
jgi:hypothetical protein